MMDFETKQSQERLLAGTATSLDRDRILYFLSSTRWEPEVLDKHIREQHNLLCEHCHRQKWDVNAIIKTLIYALAAVATAIGSLVAYFTQQG